MSKSIAPRHGLGIALMLLACLMLSVLNGAVKWLTEQGYPTLQIIFFTGLIGLVSLSAWMISKATLQKLRTSNSLVGLYTVASVGACFCLFFAFGSGNLAEVSTVVATAPIMIAVLAAIFLRERVTKLQAVLIITGFIGVLFILKPKPELSDYFVVWIAVLGTFLFSATQVIVRRLSSEVYTLVFPFFFYLGVVIILGPLMQYKPISLGDAPVFLLCGFADVISLVFLYTAFKYAPAAIAAPFQYSQILWNGLIGYLIWMEVPDSWTILGASIVVTSGIVFAHMRTQASEGAKGVGSDTISSSQRTY